MIRAMRWGMVSLLAVALVASVGQAAGQAGVGATAGPVNSASLVVPIGEYHEGYAYCADSAGGLDEAGPVGDSSPVYAGAGIGSGGAEGMTGPMAAVATASATPGAGVSAASYGYGYNAIQFLVLDTVPVTFTADYLIDIGLSTDVAGDTAGGSAVVALSLYDELGNLVDEDVFDLYPYVENGDDFYGTPYGTLSVSGLFATGTLATVTVWADAEAMAYSVPAPGALLLGTFGAGLAGWLRRRKAV